LSDSFFCYGSLSELSSSDDKKAPVFSTLFWCFSYATVYTFSLVDNMERNCSIFWKLSRLCPHCHRRVEAVQTLLCVHLL